MAIELRFKLPYNRPIPANKRVWEVRMKTHRAAAVLAVCAFTVPAFCQEPPAVLSIYREVIKEGRGSAHEKTEGDWARAMRRAKFPAHSVALTTMAGPNEVWFVERFESFAKMEEAMKAFDSGPLKNETEMLDARDGELRATSSNMIAVYRKDLSYHPERWNVGKIRYVGVTRMQLKLGAMIDFMKGTKEILAAYEKANFPMPMLAAQVVAGAPNGTFLIFMGSESLAVYDKMEEYENAMMQAMGQERAMEFMKGEGAVFQSIANTMFRVSPGMSYVSKETEDADPAFWRPKAAAAPAKPAADAKPKDKTGQ